jgi:hypothetical protein
LYVRPNSPCHLWQKGNRYLQLEKHVIDSSNWAKFYFLFIAKEKWGSVFHGGVGQIQFPNEYKSNSRNLWLLEPNY